MSKQHELINIATGKVVSTGEKEELQSIMSDLESAKYMIVPAKADKIRTGNDVQKEDYAYELYRVVKNKVGQEIVQGTGTHGRVEKFVISKSDNTRVAYIEGSFIDTQWLTTSKMNYEKSKKLKMKSFVETEEKLEDE